MDDFNSLGAASILGVDVGKAFKESKNTFGEIRKAGAILTANPVGALINELVFPRGVSDGTLEAAMTRGDIKSRIH